MSSAMEYRFCVVVESDSTTVQIGFPTANHLAIYPQKFDVDSTIAQIAFFIEKELKYTICIGRFLFCCCWVRFNNSINLISHCITLQNTSFAMVNYSCVVVDSNSTTAQCGFLNAEHQKIRHLQWNIAFVLLLSLTQQQHKLNFPLQNTWKYVFCNDKIHLCYCLFWLNNSTN